MKVTANPDRILMSEALKGQVPELEHEQVNALADQHLLVGLSFSKAEQPTVGIVHALETKGEEATVNIRLPIPEALHVMLEAGLLLQVELHLGEKVIPMSKAPSSNFLSVSACAIEEIDPAAGMCLLSIKFALRR